MKLASIIGTAVLSLTLGAAAPVYAQEEHGQDEHAQQDEKKAQPEKPAQQEEKKAQEEKSAKQDEKSAQQEKNAKPEDKSAKQENNGKPEEKNAQQQHAQPAHAAGNRGGRIPEDRFRANFGREHVFVINRPVIIEGQPRFQYGGYWFGFNQPWPVGWLYTDNVYVDYVDGGYFLFNPFHPGIRVVIIVI
jgi:hypothetical protein